jgi:hypothetical protein
MGVDRVAYSFTVKWSKVKKNMQLYPANKAVNLYKPCELIKGLTALTVKI